MKHKLLLIVANLVFLIVILTSCHEKKTDFITGERECNLTEQTWYLWPDSLAGWKNDSLFLPPVEISKLPENPPTCGWDGLPGKGIDIHLPATVEEYYWNGHGSGFGVTGDWLGVAWFYTWINVPENLRGRYLRLFIESARVRTEVYVNNHLAGYNLVDGTPFYSDITGHINYGGKNFIAIRITDPYGDFTWCDWPLFRWGNYMGIPSHGFSGITGDVKLVTTDSIYISDIFIKNTPRPDSINVEVTFRNLTGEAVHGKVSCSIQHEDDPEILMEKTGEVLFQDSVQLIRYSFVLPDARLWSPDTPELYNLTVQWAGDDNISDKATERFGFRWFEVRNVKGDHQFYLNNKRIVLRSAISWGFWPVNGIYPTDELAEKQVDLAKSIGLNMLNFHRHIGQEKILDLADEKGLLYYAEPGGYKTGGADFSNKWKREKLLRMVRHFRNHPSLIIYSMENESTINPPPEAYTDIADAHRLDETRFITYTSQYYPPTLNNGVAPRTPFPCKLYMEPYNDSLLFQGWWDEHHAGGPGVYCDEFYRNPTDYLRFSDHTGEVVFYGEEGAIGTPGRLQLISGEIERTGKKGWDGEDYLRQFKAYDTFLSERGFGKAFPDVDHLTVSFGDVAFYYQGRIIENIRINNITDGYVINGWEEEKLEDHSGIVDCYRNPKGDPAILAYYNQPLYIAVKLRNKVLECGHSTLADFFIVNEKNVNGACLLKIQARDEEGIILENEYPVSVSGGNCYGELLKEAVQIPTHRPGYTSVHAWLLREGTTVAEGSDTLFTVKLASDAINTDGMVYDTSGIINSLLQKIGVKNLPAYKGGKPTGHYLVCGAALPMDSYTVRQELIEWVAEGNVLVITGAADMWSEYLGRKEVVDYRGKKELGRLWYGGNFFVREHPLFHDLPVNTAFNWEYQCFARYNRERYGLRLSGDEIVVGAYSDHRHEMYSAVSIIRVGRGEIILSTLDILPNLKSEDPSSAVAGKLLLNYLEYASGAGKIIGHSGI